MKKVVLRNARAEQYICAARKNFIMKHGVLSESHSKTFICHFSDIHADWERFENVVDLIEYHQPTFSVHTGDMVCWDSNSETDVFFEKINALNTPVFNCLGNHETFCGEEVLSNGYLHDRYIAPLKNIQGADDKAGYYFVDFPKDALRLIVLNVYENDDVKNYRERSYEIRQKQVDWLIARLKECEEQGIAVIIAAHETGERILPALNDIGFCQRFEPHPWGPPNPPEHHIVEDIVDAFQFGKRLKRKYIWSKSGQQVQVDCEFSKKSEFICHMSGHVHGDYIEYLPSYPNQLALVMPSSSCFPVGYHNIGEEVSDLPRIPGTVSEDLVNFYVIDREKKEISVVRVGAYVNDLLEERLFARYSYKVKD